MQGRHKPKWRLCFPLPSKKYDKSLDTSSPVTIRIFRNEDDRNAKNRFIYVVA
jgi:hypothetical protein